MNKSFLTGMRILAVDPASRGMGYVLLEGPEDLVDWGFQNTRGDKDAEYEALINAADFIAILRLKAQRHLAGTAN